MLVRFATGFEMLLDLDLPDDVDDDASRAELSEPALRVARRRHLVALVRRPRREVVRAAADERSRSSSVCLMLCSDTWRLQSSDEVLVCSPLRSARRSSDWF